MKDIGQLKHVFLRFNLHEDIISMMRFSTLKLSIGLFLCLWTVSIHAANYTVNSTANNPDADLNAAACADLNGNCTLRAAIEQANFSAATPDTINFDTTLFAAARTISLNAPLPQITDALTITGTSPALLTIDGTGNYRVFNVASGVTVNISNLTAANGFTSDMNDNGGGILNAGSLSLTNIVVRNSEASSGSGGGISNIGGTVTLMTSTVRDNVASGNGGGISTDGGTINITRSTIGSSTAFGSNRASGGGGIYNQNGATNLTNSTVTGNFATGFGGGYYGFATLSATTLTAGNATIAFNTGVSGGGIAVSAGLGVSTARINNTIVSNSNPGVAMPPRPDLFGTIVSNGYNIVQDTSGATINQTATDQFGFNPLLEPLADNGGLTQTHALRSIGGTSPAIDKGNSALPLPAVTEDQRGLPRPVDITTIPPAAGGNNSDIGAFELQSIPTAAGVTIGGRVISSNGRGISRARVTLTDSSGETRTAMTNFFGYYRFKSVGVGETYIFNVSSKYYSFNPQVITIQEELTELNFIAEP